MAITGKTFSEKAWKWVNVSDGGKCRECESPTSFLGFNKGYLQFCSTKCMAGNDLIRQTKKQTTIEKYGVSHYSSSDLYKRQFKETCLQKYGVENPGQIADTKKARARSKQETYFKHLCREISKFSQPKFLFDDYTHVRDKTLAWDCVTCDKSFESDLFGKLPKCPDCYPSKSLGGQSSVEKDILSEILKFYPGTILENTRQIISPKELDLYFPDAAFAIEVNGIYWHSDQHVDKLYHQTKFSACQKNGISLLMITDNEWFTQRELVIRMIKHRLGKTSTKIYAKCCYARKIDSKTGKEFLNKNHLHGNSNASKYYGLYFNDELLSVVSVMNNRFKRDITQLEIVRLAFSEKSVIGALGKFIKLIRTDYPTKDIISYADLRYGSGLVYEKNGFEVTHITQPGYWYFFNGIMYHRLNWTKKKLVNMGHDPSLTEEVLMQEMGALKIYDCGHKHYVLKGDNT